MKIVFLDTATLGDDVDLSAFETLGDVTYYRTTDPSDIPSRLADADVAVLNKIKLNESNLKDVKNLKLICVCATGTDNIDSKYCEKRGIAVKNVAGYSTDSVAALTVATVLQLAVHMDEYTRFVRDGSYSLGSVANRLSPPYHDLFGKTWGIVGYGNIGRRIGGIAKAFGCRLIVNKRTPVDDAECVDIDTLCRESDVITLNCPLTDATRNLINAERIAMMKKDVLIVNAARGGVWDEKAVAEAIANGRIGGVGCDVYTSEPFGKDHPFYAIRKSANVCLTPHMAWGSVEARKILMEKVYGNIKTFFEG